MVFGMPDPEEERRRLVRRAEDQLSAPTPYQSPVPQPFTQPQPSAQVQPFAQPQAVARTERRAPLPAGRASVRRGQGLSWSVVLLGLLGTGMVGVGLYAALAAIQFSAHPFAEASTWGSVATFGLVIILFAVLGAVIALFLARPKLVATVGLLLALIGPWIAAIVGGKLGADAFGAHANQALGDSADNLGDILIALMTTAGVDPEPYRQLIEIIFR